MSYGASEGKWKEANELLKTCLQQYEFISKAPRSPNDYQKEQEKIKRYKSTDGAGNVYLIQNPAAWEERQNANGSTTFIRPVPQLLMTFAQLKAEAALVTKPGELNYDGQKMIGSL